MAALSCKHVRRREDEVENQCRMCRFFECKHTDDRVGRQGTERISWKPSYSATTSKNDWFM